MSFTPRDTIQVSLGPSANAVTAHSLNLQGLAATPSDDGQATCDPGTTHRLERNVWVPRVLMVDEPSRFFVDPQVSGYLASPTPPPVVGGLGPSAFGIEAFNPNTFVKHEDPQWSQFLNTASVLAHSSHSRYYQEPQDSSSYQASSSNPRHVVWDDNEEEPEEDPLERQVRQQRAQQTWKRDTLEPLQEEMTQELANPPPNLRWMDFWMPPYSPTSKLALPFSQQSHVVAHWDSYPTDQMGSWKEDVLMDGFRHLLESCDACQGVVVTTQGHGLYAGLTTSLLQEVQEEVKSAGRVVFHITNPSAYDKAESPKEQENTENEGPGWQPAHVDRLRRQISSGLALHDFTQNAHAVLPLRLKEDAASLYHASAQLAIALEVSTLPFRLSHNNDPRYRIGLLNAPFFGQGGGDSQWGSTAQRLTMSEFLTCVQPSTRYNVLELDVMDQPSTDKSNAQLWDALQQGTSLERDARMREYGRDELRIRPRNVPPGEWMQDVKRGGLLTSASMTPSTTAVTDRSLHHHFALSTAVRPVLQGELSDYLTALVQGMGIRYRPERSVSTVLNQTVGQLAQGGYGAGAYWNSLVAVEAPVMAVLGNTTRIYPYLRDKATEMKFVMGPRYRGYYQRDVQNGVLPEVEDCQEALEGCFDLRDVYLPPEGSGLGDDDVDIDT